MLEWLWNRFGWRKRKPVVRKRQRQSQRPAYTGRDSLTRKQIVMVLERRGDWMTRDEISSKLDVTTAGIHLPAMVKDGLIVSRWVLRKKQYRIVPQVDRAAEQGEEQ